MILRGDHFRRGDEIGSRGICAVEGDQFISRLRLEVFIEIQIRDFQRRICRKHEFCAGQRSICFAIDFGDAGRERYDLDLGLWRFAGGFAVGIIGVGQESFVGFPTSPVVFGRIVELGGIVYIQRVGLRRSLRRP